ncbi:MAG: CPBP family glutamic-type intramembrane protease [Anaerolineae bacterium]
MYPPDEPQQTPPYEPPPNDVSDADYKPYVPPPVDEEPKPKRVAYRGEASDPLFGYIIAIALSIGLLPLLGQNGADLRYTLAWGALAAFGVLSWLLGSGTRIAQERPENLVWGVIFGFIVGVPLLAFGGSTLSTTVKRLFEGMTVGSLLAYLIFVMPLAETLFFRGLLQQGRSLWLVALLSTIWSALLYLPLLDISRYPAPSVVIAVALIMMNVMYSYVRQRNGLAAAWLCQITANIALLVVPFISG